MNRAWVAPISVPFVLACSREAPAPAEAASAAPLASAVAAAAVSGTGSAAPAGKPPLEAARYSGSYETTAHHIDVPLARGGLPEWAADDGKRATGRGKIDVEVSPDGTVTGTASGPLGPQRVAGALGEGILTARLVAETPEAHAGTLVARQEGDRFTGTLASASTDGRVSRSGTVALSRKAP